MVADYDFDTGESGLPMTAGVSQTEIMVQPPGSGKSVIVDSLTVGLALNSRGLTSGRVWVALGHGNPSTSEFVQHGVYHGVDFSRDLTKVFTFGYGMETGFGTGKALKYRVLTSVTCKVDIAACARVETTTS